MKRIVFVLPLVIVGLMLAVFMVINQPASASQDSPKPEIRYAIRSDSTIPLREHPVMPAEAGRKNLPAKHLPEAPIEDGPFVDPVLDGSGGPLTETLVANFAGLTNRNGVYPPDTNGDIGQTHYVQWVNLSLQAWSINRSTNPFTATSVLGPINGSQIWLGFGGSCERNNSGDPIVLYDQAANRWNISQFSFDSSATGPYYQCIAISQTSDPAGAWYRYEFLISNNKMNDYPKLGVWPDAYYMAVNQFLNGGSYSGAGVVAFERSQMLVGGPARMVYFDLASNGGGLLPADWDGAIAPPANTPAIFSRRNDNPDQLEIYQFAVNWTNPSASTFGLVQTLPVSAFTSICTSTRSCMTQPGTSVGLDDLGDRLMHRLQYRNFGSYQTLVANHTVDVDGTSRAGIRWYELRKTTGNWAINQQSTFSPDSTDRWMASVGMNGRGDMGLGYSISSATIYPSIYATGRLATDALNTMPQGEAVLKAGTGSQTGTASRWGDYSMLSIDPVDDCTFWFTSEFIRTTGGASWETQISAFRLPGCGVTVDLPPSVTLISPLEGATINGSIIVTANAADDIGVTKVDFFTNGTLFATDTVSPYEATLDTTTLPEGSNTITSTATDTGGQTASDTHTVTVNRLTVQSIFIQSLTGVSVRGKSNWKATVTTTVYSDNNQPAGGVTVNFTWSGGYNASGFCVTQANGVCVVTTGGIKNTRTSVTFSVTSLVKSGFVYDPTKNSASSITVTR